MPVTSSDEARIIAVMRRLAIEAGRIILEVQRGDFDVEAKDDASPVTVADRKADAHISAGLRAAFPDIALVTEEQAATHDERADEFFIVDPLDGTKEFIRGASDFTVNIALVRDGVPVQGVIYAPARGRLFATLPGGGAVEETGALDPQAPGETRRIEVADATGRGLRVVASKSHRNPETDAFISRHETESTVSAGSSLKFCLVATGEADLYPRFGPTMEWDTAAGDAILRAAGGRVTETDGVTDLAYGKPEFRNGHFLAFAPGVALRP